MTGPRDALTPAQRAALEHVRARAVADRRPAREALARLLGPAAAATLAARVAAGARITLNFHPDRLLADGRSVAAALLADGIYRSQFETGVSSGSRTAFPGGERDRWEAALFGGAYQAAGVAASERPRYGGLDLMRHPDGACPRFGSCHLVLRAELLARATFCLGDSHRGPRWVGTVDALEAVLAARLATIEAPAIAARLAELDRPPAPAARRAPGRALDDYVEAQIHGTLDLARDAEALVVDPSFAGTECGEHLRAIAARFDLAFDAHAGFTVAVAEVPDDFRGPGMRPLAAWLLREHAAPGRERIDAALLGRGAAAIARDPARWRDLGSADEALQAVKQLWHVLVAFGAPAAT